MTDAILSDAALTHILRRAICPDAFFAFTPHAEDPDPNDHRGLPRSPSIWESSGIVRPYDTPPPPAPTVAPVPPSTLARLRGRSYVRWPAPAPRTALLLVSKRWRRVGTPLLYASVRLRTPADVALLAAVLATHPSMGALVRNLRVDGPACENLREAAQYMRSVCALHVDLRVGTPAGLRGLGDALEFLEPTALYMEDAPRRDRIGTYSRKASQLLAVTVGQRWTSLTKIAFSRHVSMDMHLRDDCEGPLWLAALHCTPALEYLTLSREGASGLIVNLFGVEPYPLCDVLRSPRLRRVYSYEPQICFCDPTSIEFLERNVPRFRELLAFEPPTRQELEDFLVGRPQLRSKLGDAAVAIDAHPMESSDLEGEIRRVEAWNYVHHVLSPL